MAKTVLITGCSSGIGSYLVLSFHKRGLTVFATARNINSLAFSDLKNVHPVALDVTSEESVRQAYEQVKNKSGGRLDYLVNNAGTTLVSPAIELSIEAAKKVFESNFWGALRMIQVFAPLVIEAKGTIVNNSSGLGYAHGPYMSIYNASKAALNMLGETLRLEVAPFDVKVLTIVTGAVATPFMAKNEEPQLIPGSRYLAVEKQIKAAAKDSDRKRTPSDQYAEAVVSDILGGVTGKTYRGAQAGLVKYLIPFIPMWLFDRIMLDGSGLPEMKATMKKQN